MKTFFEITNIITSFVLTLIFCLILWFIPGPNAVTKAEVIKHGGAHWETTPTGSTVFVWNK